MADTLELIDRHNALVAENNELAEYASVADAKIEQLELYIYQLERQLAVVQGTICEE